MLRVKRLITVGLISLLISSAHGDLYRFYPITYNDQTGYAQFVGETQLFMSLYWLDMGLARLVFVNDGSEDAVISEIYFDFAPALNLTLESIGNDSGVSFSEKGVQPANLPSGRSIFSTFETDLSVGAVNPSPKNGINPGERLELTVSHDAAYNLDDLMANEELRVGLHVISIGEYSESFVNTVPEPATLPLLLTGSLLLRWLRITKSKRKRDKYGAIPLPGHSEPSELGWVEVKATRNRFGKPRNRCEAAIHKVTA